MYGCTLRKMPVVVVMGLLMVGCTGAPAVPPTLTPTAASSTAFSPQPWYCQPADPKIVGMITSRFNLGGQPPFNPSVVQLSPDHAIVAFGSVTMPPSAYLMDPSSDDPSRWILVLSDDIDYWDRLNLPADVVSAGRPAAQLAIGCVRGG